MTPPLSGPSPCAAPCRSVRIPVLSSTEILLMAAVDFEKGIVWIKWIGTHADYDRIDVTEVEHEG